MSPPATRSSGLTPRTRTLFGEPGRAYVYRSYGIHALFNAVCEPVGVGAAVLIRALAPIDGIETMRVRREGRRTAPASVGEHDLCSGPGKLTQALGISLAHNGCELDRGPVRILAVATDASELQVIEGPRIGITKAVELPWRFSLAGDPNVSRPRPVVPTAPRL